MPAFRLAVLSDLHLDAKVSPDSWALAQRAFAAVGRAKVDHVVIAGDLFDCATAMLRDHPLVRQRLRKLGLWHR
jgi:3',5'-cyclic AMP phosphodiesterase CpdA